MFKNGYDVGMIAIVQILEISPAEVELVLKNK